MELCSPWYNYLVCTQLQIIRCPYNQGVYREKQLRLTAHWTRTNYDDNYIAIKPLVLNSPKMQYLQERKIFKSL